ncbi:hypothetical protein Ancab_030853 [Ancistrocladus abbreviatus]
MEAALASPPSSTLPLQDRVAIVTGSSRGIGKCIALHLASLGAKVVVSYASSSALGQEVVSEINSSWSAASSSPRAIAVEADVSDPEQVKALFDTVEKAFHDQVHILVACAGIIDTTLPTIANTSVESFDKLLNLNTKGTFFCIREAAKRLKKGGGGRIITFSGTLPNENAPGFGVYRASTKAIEPMTKVVAKELKGTKITANCVVPRAVKADCYPIEVEGFFEVCTNPLPLLRLGETKDITALIGFLVSDDGEWINGQVITMDGGACI